MSILKYSKRIKSEAGTLFDKGWGAKAVSSYLNVPFHTVRDWKRLWLIEPDFLKVNRRSPQKFSDELKEQILDEHEQGVSWAELSYRHGVMPSTMRHWAAKRAASTAAA